MPPIPTRLKLPEQDIDQLLEAGQDAVTQSLTVRYFVARVLGVTESLWRPEPASITQ